MTAFTGRAFPEAAKAKRAREGGLTVPLRLEEMWVPRGSRGAGHRGKTR